MLLKVMFLMLPDVGYKFCFFFINVSEIFSSFVVKS